MKQLWVAVAVLLLLSQALPAAAQTRGSYAQTCRTVRGQMICRGGTSSGGATGDHAYDRWQDGSAAVGGSTSPDSYRYPQYLGGHNSWYGFGR